MAVRLGELLLLEKCVTPAQLQEALNYQRANGGRLGAMLGDRALSRVSISVGVTSSLGNGLADSVATRWL